MTHGENHFKLQALTDKHRQVASLLAQGLGPSDIAAVVDFVPQYITMLTRDPLFKEYLREMSEVAEARHEALFQQTPDIVASAFRVGTVEEQLKAARLNLEITGRIGKGERPNNGTDTSIERLNTLADRLLGLLGKVRSGQTYDGESTVDQQPQLVNQT